MLRFYILQVNIEMSNDEWYCMFECLSVRVVLLIVKLFMFQMVLWNNLIEP